MSEKPGDQTPTDSEARDPETPKAKPDAGEPRRGSEPGGREPRLRDLARRLLREAEERRERMDRSEGRGSGRASRAADDTEASDGAGEESRRRELRELLGVLLATGNNARAELIRLIAKEVRFYLEAAELDALLADLVTNYSLEVNASIHLKPLSDDPSPPTATAGLKRREPEEPEAE